MSRSSRPAKRALPLISRSRWTPDLLLGVAEGESRALGKRLAEGGIEGVVRAAEEASRRAAELDRAAIARDPPPAPIACADKCAACCVSKVAVVAPEILRIAEHLRRALDASAFADLLARVRAADERTRGLTRRERALAGVPCPLLDAGSCSIHAVRPLICRGWSSLDRGACERHFASRGALPVAPAHAPSYELASAVLAGLGKACNDAGLDGGALELVAALRIALERPNAADRWLRRLPVFAQARDAEVGNADEDDA